MRQLLETINWLKGGKTRKRLLYQKSDEVSDALKALWHIETLAPGEVPDSGTISKGFTKDEVKKLHKIDPLQRDLIPDEWKNINFRKDSMKPNWGLYGCCFSEYQVLQYQRDYYNVTDEIHNKSVKNCFSFFVSFDENSKYIEGSLFVPLIMLFIKQTSNNKSPFKSDFFEEYYEACEYLEGQAKSIYGGQFSSSWLDVFIEEFNKVFALLPNVSKKENHYLELIISDGESLQKDKFNSFFSEDIFRAIQEKSSTVEQFFVTPKKRIDINENRKFIEDSLHPLNTPLGRWPSSIKHKSSLMQQVAVNEFFKSDAHIQSVNGPPGTGKTTLLKDIFAEIVVRKAEALTAFRDAPDKALIDTGLKVTIKNRFNGEDVSRKVYDIDSSISAHAIVVASSNNTAVENISKDLPKIKEISEEFIKDFKPLNYASGISEKITDSPSWGMFSLPMGKGENIKKASSLLTGETFSVMNSLARRGGKRTDRMKEWKKACDEFKDKYNEVVRIRKTLSKSADNYKKHPLSSKEFIPSTDVFWLDKEYENRQEAVLYQTDELNRKRSELFIKALIVLRYFLSINHGKIEAALSLLNDNRHEVDTNSEDGILALKAMWNTIHCVCPVISTTFASFSSMYKGMPKEFIPNLFIDEAGQATPTQAIGALWRSKKVLAVGDPLQIEPVQTVEASLLNDLGKIYKVDKDIINIKSSVQSLADRSNALGTYISEDKWIGIPLWVHRRCVNPMFSISNALAYNGKMVLASKMKYNTGGIGEWIDKKGKAEAKHYVKEQAKAMFDNIKESMTKYLRFQLLQSMMSKLDDGDELEKLLKEATSIKKMDTNWSINQKQSYFLMHKYLELRNKRSDIQLQKEIKDFIKGEYSYPSVFVITPFSIIKDRIKKEIVPGLFKGMEIWLNKSLKNDIQLPEDFNLNEVIEPEIKTFKNYYDHWRKENIGTVHTFQGKEADIVYFVSGTDLKSINAAEWACKEPNLLNVAVTRAKKEFYLIGDKELLSRFHNYKIIIKEFERHSSEIFQV